ncbi:MAG: hypothetical protein K8S24_12500 [Candidatus Aegiribacteria sp.]|nr:hypothetical protein [Candidatus Aegiribacteria sp.]
MVFMILVILSGSWITDATAETVLVHEWGVVLIDEAIPMVRGAQRGYLDENGTLQPYYSMIVDAPVIWFHGPEFTGTLTVEVQNGYFSLLIPLPVSSSTCDETIPVFLDEENYLAVWEDLSFTYEYVMTVDRPVDVDGIPGESAEEGFQWAMPLWRRVQALTVTYEAASYIDRFIYYECSASNLFEEHDPLGNCECNAMVFYEENGELAADLVADPANRTSTESSLSSERIVDILSDWGGNEFQEDEIKALWKTWEPSLRTRCMLYGETIVLFPLTDEQVESISTIELQTDQGYNVEYSRLFLVLCQVSDVV